MKIGILADIHGNYPALKAILSALKRHHVKQIICAGDIVGYYPYVNEVIEEIKRQEIKCIFGNHDDALLKGISIEESYSATVTLEYARKIIKAKNLKYLSSLKMIESRNINGVEITILHGGIKDPLNERIYFQEDFTSPVNYKGIVIGGHTHIPTAFNSGQTIYLNPGSCGQPRDFDIRAACCILDFSTMKYTFLRVMYDIDSVFKKMSELGFDSRIGWSLYTGDWVGKSKLGKMNHFKIKSTIEKGCEVKRFDYCTHLQMKSPQRTYNCIIKDDVPYVISTPVYLKKRDGAKKISHKDVKVKENVAAVYKSLNEHRINNLHTFDEIERIKRDIL